MSGQAKHPVETPREWLHYAEEEALKAARRIRARVIALMKAE